MVSANGGVPTTARVLHASLLRNSGSAPAPGPQAPPRAQYISLNRRHDKSGYTSQWPKWHTVRGQMSRAAHDQLAQVAHKSDRPSTSAALIKAAWPPSIVRLPAYGSCPAHVNGPRALRVHTQGRTSAHGSARKQLLGCTNKQGAANLFKCHSTTRSRSTVTLCAQATPTADRQPHPRSRDTAGRLQT